MSLNVQHGHINQVINCNLGTPWVVRWSLNTFLKKIILSLPKIFLSTPGMLWSKNPVKDPKNEKTGKNSRFYNFVLRYSKFKGVSWIFFGRVFNPWPHFQLNFSVQQTRSQRGGWRICPRKFFNLLRFLRKRLKIPPPKFFHTKNLKIPPRKISGYAAGVQ